MYIFFDRYPKLMTEQTPHYSYSIETTRSTGFARVRVMRATPGCHRFVHVEVLQERATREEWDAVKAHVQEAYDESRAAREFFSLLMDIRKMGILPLEYGKEWIQLFRDNAATTRELLCSSALVVSNPILLGAVNFFLSLYSPIKPFLVTSNSDAAKGHCESHFPRGVSQVEKVG